MKYGILMVQNIGARFYHGWKMASKILSFLKT